MTRRYDYRVTINDSNSCASANKSITELAEEIGCSREEVVARLLTDYASIARLESALLEARVALISIEANKESEV